jgi:glutamate dehydrogenase/leucine dehydrogenase
MKALLQTFEQKAPEIVFEWTDSETSAKGWVVINSLRGGAAGGGTRMRIGLTKHEVLSLAKTMEVKFTVSGPAIGGAKSGIDFDPADPRKHEVLSRWYKAVIPLLKNYYGTGGDLNIDEIEEVIPITEEYGLWHPQEGVVNGHFKPTEAEKIRKVGQLRLGVSKILEDTRFFPMANRRYTVADMITGYGVAESVRHYYANWGGKLSEKRAIIQGWGNVAAAAGYYLAKEGVKIVGIIDRAGGVINTEGLSFDEVIHLFTHRAGNQLISDELIPFAEINEQIWSVGAEIFIPAAASRIVTQAQIEAMVANGLEVISSGANVPFSDQEIFYGPIAAYADSIVSVVPDFVANCGMARVFAYLMSTTDTITDEAIFNDVSTIIGNALQAAHKANPNRTHITEACYGIALKQLV